MKDFLFCYWKELSYVLVAILTILVTIFRKKGKVDPVLEKVLESAPAAICAAEKQYGSGHGELKKAMVMSILSKVYSSLTGYELKENSGIWKFISNSVESILSTPSRKEK